MNELQMLALQRLQGLSQAAPGMPSGGMEMVKFSKPNPQLQDMAKQRLGQYPQSVKIPPELAPSTMGPSTMNNPIDQALEHFRNRSIQFNGI